MNPVSYDHGGHVVRRWMMAMVMIALTLTLFAVAVPTSSVQASVNMEFSNDLHAGKYVQMGGRQWIVVQVVDDKPLLMMDSTYGSIPWNTNGDSTDASEIMQYLDDHFDQIIPVAEDRDKIAVTEWEIRSMKFDDRYNVYTTAGGNEIDPSSVTQKLAIMPMKVINDHCSIVKKVMTDSIWTLTPDHSSGSKAFSAWLTPFIGDQMTCQFGQVEVTTKRNIQPVLYLEDSVKIRGGAGTEDDPYVLSVTNDPVSMKADGTTDLVTVWDVPANAKVRVYAADGTSEIGSKTNGGSLGTIDVSVSRDLRLGDEVYVSLTQPGKAESGKVKTTVVDDDPPSILLSVASKLPTNLDVSVTATITDGGSAIVEQKWAQGAQNIEFFRSPGDWTDFTGNTFTVSDNGVYTVYAKDAAGNDSREQIEINNIDRIEPTLYDVHISSSNTRSSEWAKTDDEIELTFTASEELGSLEVTIAGRSATVANTGGLAYSATYTMQDTDPEEIVTFSIDYDDLAGNTGDTVINTADGSKVTFDRTPPVAPSFSADIEVPTSGNVEVEIDCPGDDVEECMYKIGVDGSWLDYDEPVVMNENGIVYARAVDVAGNESEIADYTVDHIDREAPTVFNVSIISSNEYHPDYAKVGDTIELTFQASETLIDLPVVTIAGQKAAVTSTGVNVYKATYTMQETDAEKVVAFTIDYTDLAGNVGEQKTVTSDESQVTFDRTAPGVATFAPDVTQPTNEDVAVTIDFPTDAYLRQFRTSEDQPWVDYTAPVVMSENGTVFARSIDPAGNVSAVSTYTVSNIDTEPPMIDPPHFDPGTLTNQNVTVTVAVYDQSHAVVDTRWAVGVQTVDYFDQGGGKSFDDFFVVKMNGDYTIYALDEAGNANTAVFTVSHIFKEEPQIELTAEPAFPTNGTVTVTASVYALHGVEVQKYALGQHPLEYFATKGEPLGPDPIEMTDNGWVTVYVLDPAGNAKVESLEITNIDRDSPVLELVGEAEMRVRKGSPFTDPGATAWDVQDGDLSEAIVVAGDAVDTSRTGIYEVEYRVADRAGNEADPVNRTVIVYKQKSNDEDEAPPNSVNEPEDANEVTDPVDADEPDDVTDPTEPEDAMQPVVFSDIANHWAEQHILQAAERKLISGYPGGSFKPDHPITRAEFIVILVQTLELEEAAAELDFVDRQQIGLWARQAIAQALQLGIVQGYEDGSFRPNQQITRAEMSAIIARAIGLSDDQVEQTSFSDDQEIPAWAKAAVDEMRKQGIILGRGNNLFAPNAPATRAEAAVIMLKLIGIDEP